MLKKDQSKLLNQFEEISFDTNFFFNISNNDVIFRNPKPFLRLISKEHDEINKINWLISKMLLKIKGMCTYEIKDILRKCRVSLTLCCLFL